MKIRDNFVINNREIEEYRNNAEERLKLFNLLLNKFPEIEVHYLEKLNNLHDCIFFLFKAQLLSEGLTNEEFKGDDDLYSLYEMLSDKLPLAQDKVTVIKNLSKQYKDIKLHLTKNSLVLPLHEAKYKDLATEIYNKISSELLNEIITTIPMRSS